MAANEPYRVDPEQYRRFPQQNHAFNALSRDLGESWYVRFRHKRLENVEAGRTSIKAPLADPGEALSQYGLSIGLGVLEFLLQPMMGLLSERNQTLWQGTDADVPPEVLARRSSDAALLTREARRVALASGACLVGVTEIDPRWVYAEVCRDHQPEMPRTWRVEIDGQAGRDDKEDAVHLPSSLKHAIVVAVPMNREMILSAPSLLAETATNQGYAEASRCVVSLANYIRAIGYRALPCLNDTALSIPLAIDAGLGEMGRNGMLITPEYGPCIRLAKVFTDMPLVTDRPVDLGVQAFCEVCGECARQCPSRAIAAGAKTWTGHNECNSDGVYKWHVNQKQCLRYWVASGTSCSVCIASCPFVLGRDWLGGLPQRIIRRTSRYNRVLARLGRRATARLSQDPSGFLRRTAP